MPDHVTISEVNYNKVVLCLVNGSNELILHLKSTHLRLQIVSSHLRRSYEDTILTLIRLLTTTVKEERHMSIFLRLSGMQLLLTLFA